MEYRELEETQPDFARIAQEGRELLREIAANMPRGATSSEVQCLIDQHFNNLRYFYHPSLVMYRKLAQMYVDDPRYLAYYEKYAPGLAVFMRNAMVAYCEAAGEEGEF